MGIDLEMIEARVEESRDSFDSLPVAASDALRLVAECRRLREVIGYYANPKLWPRNVVGVLDTSDLGKPARIALEG